MNEIYEILNNAQGIGSNAVVEIKKMNIVQDELKCLNQEWKDRNKLEGERKILIEKAKIAIMNNADMLSKMKSLLNTSNEKVN